MENKRQPNIVLLMSDQHRYDCVGFSQKYPVKTPNIDRLAEKGVWFNNAYCTVPTCCPARQSLISGQRPERFGAHWNYDITLKVADLSPDNFSFAKSLKQSGYQTVYIGKWHVSSEHTPLEFGFDSYYGEGHYGEWFRAQGYKNPWSVVGERGTKAMLGWKSDIPYEVAPPHFFARKAIEKIDELSADEDHPFLIVMSLSEPHLPCCPSEPFASIFTPKDVVKWGGFDDIFEDKPYIQKQMTRNWMLENLDWDDWSECVARYYACIAQVDDAVGNVIRHLEATGLASDTVIIYTADHGDMCGSHHML
ncbi:MAG: sulfatase-like hydrolase/transferase, partial [Lachnospiraceae bacterium]|nr:sulfatase-like hydrolase/transferase [Lachnospiraceae bacterium]